MSRRAPRSPVPIRRRPGPTRAASAVRTLLLVAAITLFPAPQLAEGSDSALEIPGLADRLGALRPDDPLDYFLLAEEVSAEIPGDRGRSLARRLFVLAHEIDRASSRPRGLAVSVYLALAELADRPGEREWLLALAGNVGSRFEHARRPAITRAEPSDAAHPLAEIIGLARAADGREVKPRIQKEALIPALEALTASHPEVRRIIDDAARQPFCPACRNARTIRSLVPRQGGGNEEVFTLCPACRGNPGLALNAEQFRATLAAESELLAAEHRQWSAQTWLDDGAPQRDPDPDELASYYHIDRAAVIWRSISPSDPFDGQWVEPAPEEAPRVIQ